MVGSLNRYDEYGNVAGTLNGRFGYTGQAWLPEIGMHYYKARLYNQSLGRFMQTDPVGYQDQFNLYAYVGNDPANQVDPTGKDALVILRENGDVEITLPIVFTGNAATPENISAIINSISSTFSGNFDGRNVTTSVVQLTQTQARDAEIVNTMEITAGPTVGSVNAPGHSYVLKGSEAHVSMIDQAGGSIAQPNGTVTQGTKGGLTAAHEGGHLLGLGDTRRVGSGIMDSGPGRAVTGNDLRDITQRNTPSGAINTIIRCPSEDCPRD